MITIKVTTKPKVEPLPSGWRPARVKHTHEVSFYPKTGEGLSYIADRMWNQHWAWTNGDPSAIRFITPAGEKVVRVTPAMEWGIYNCIKECAGDILPESKLLNAYRNLMRSDKCYNNFSGWDNGYQSVVLKENIGSDMMGLSSVICTGAMIMVIGGKTRVGGKEVYPILALKPGELFSYKESIWTVHAATNSITAPRDDPWHPGLIDPWPILGDVGRTTPFPTFSPTGVLYIETKWVDFVDPNTRTRMNPYYKSAYGNIKY